MIPSVLLQVILQIDSTTSLAPTSTSPRYTEPFETVHYMFIAQTYISQLERCYEVCF
jgi:hypothetical protein